jgi:hypothetical protein
LSNTCDVAHLQLQGLLLSRGAVVVEVADYGDGGMVGIIVRGERRDGVVG